MLEKQQLQVFIINFIKKQKYKKVVDLNVLLNKPVLNNFTEKIICQ